jgi:hypothetical protein
VRHVRAPVHIKLNLHGANLYQRGKINAPARHQPSGCDIDRMK